MMLKAVTSSGSICAQPIYNSLWMPRLLKPGKCFPRWPCVRGTSQKLSLLWRMPFRWIHSFIPLSLKWVGGFLECCKASFPLFQCKKTLGFDLMMPISLKTSLCLFVIVNQLIFLDKYQLFQIFLLSILITDLRAASNDHASAWVLFFENFSAKLLRFFLKKNLASLKVKRSGQN